MQNTKRIPLKAYTIPGSFIGKTWEGYLIAPVGRNRDSDLLTQSNWEAQLQELRTIPMDPEAEIAEWEIVSENHWACGWIEWIAVRSDAVAYVEALEELAYRLDQYPSLDDDKWSAMEWESAHESFDRYNVQDLATEFERAFGLKAVTVERFKEIDPGEVLAFMVETVGWSEIVSEGGGASFRWNNVASAKDCTRDALAKFLCTNR